MLRFERILVPVDFSEFSRRALATCSTLFSGEDAREFHFLYVWRPPSDEIEVDGDPTEELQQKLREFVQAFRHEGEHRTITAVVTGHPATSICAYAEEHGCDLIAMSTHGRTGFKHLLIGSTAEQVVRHAPCPVLTLRGH